MHNLPCHTPAVKPRPKIDLQETARLEAEAADLGSPRARNLLRLARKNHADGALSSAYMYQKAAMMCLRDCRAAIVAG